MSSDECVGEDFSLVHTIAGAADTELISEAITNVGNSFIVMVDEIA